MKHIPHAGNAATPGNATLRSGVDSPGNATLRSGMDSPGNATLRSGENKTANREIGAPRVKTANREIGDPRGNQWHSRGYLPHFDSAVAVQHVTFHLADSLPESVLERLEQEVRCLPSEKQDAERRKRLDAWIDAGHGSCIMREPPVARIVQSAFLFFDGQRYRLLAWVVMPNHVHVLFQPVNGWTVAKIVASWKKFTATKICSPGNATLRSGENEYANREIGDPMGNPVGKSGGGIKSPVWHREYWDRFIRDCRHYEQAVEYIHQNPAKAGLTATAAEWPWSSASFSGMDSPGNATLRSGENEYANREIGDPGWRRSYPG